MTSQASEWIELRAPDGHRFAAYEAQPPRHPRGTVVVLQEIFGVNRHIQSVARRLAEEGWRAIAPALFDRQRRDVSLDYDGEGIAAGKALLATLPLQTALLDVEAAVRHASALGPVAALGFCWGGSLAWLAGSRLPVAGVVAYYGGQIGSLLDKAPRVPTLTHFGEQDASIPIEVSQAIRRDQPQVITHLYAAGHGFNCDERPSYDLACTQLAWQRSLGFLNAVF